MRGRPAHGGRLDFGVGRGVAPIEHAWFGSNWTQSTPRFEDTLGIICNAFATGEISSAGSVYHDFPTVPLSTKPLQAAIPFWYPDSPITAGRHGMSLMCAGPIDQRTYDLYVETWHKHVGDTLRVEGLGARPRVGCTMLIAIAPTEQDAVDVARRGMDSLVRRARAVHKYDHLVLTQEECATALVPLERILAHIEDVVAAGAGTPDQIAERFAAMLEPGLIDYVALQLPTGDMTFAEAKRTVELFVSDVKPLLEQDSLAV